MTLGFKTHGGHITPPPPLPLAHPCYEIGRARARVKVTEIKNLSHTCCSYLWSHIMGVIDHSNCSCYSFTNFLGVRVTCLRKKALRMLALITNVSYKSKVVIRKLIDTYVRPILEYCMQAWSPIFEKDYWLLERIQTRATKLIPWLSSMTYEDRLRKLFFFL